MPIPFACRTPGGAVVRLDDCPIEELQEIADSHGIESWFDLAMQPVRFGKPAVALYRYCVERAGETPPEGSLSVRTVFDAFEMVDDDTLPTLWEDGNPPTADDPTTP